MTGRGAHTHEVVPSLSGLLPCSTISDLAYCGEVEAMVTAAQDSTVKVWEADWQIRMVFVGHTGALSPVALEHSLSTLCTASALWSWAVQSLCPL